MESIKSLIVAGIIILVIIAGGLFFYSKSAKTKIPVVSTSLQKIAQVQPSTEQDIILTANGFSPSVITVNTGTKVKWINRSGKMADVDSDPHTTHTSYPAMNFGQFSNGSSVELVFDKPGSYHYHNHLNPSQVGTVVVE